MISVLRLEVQHQPQVNNKVEASLGYLRHCLNKWDKTLQFYSKMVGRVKVIKSWGLERWLSG